jgi:hypothetical protein
MLKGGAIQSEESEESDGEYSEEEEDEDDDDDDYGTEPQAIEENMD